MVPTQIIFFRKIWSIFAHSAYNFIDMTLQNVTINCHFCLNDWMLIKFCNKIKKFKNWVVSKKWILLLGTIRQM